VGARRSKNAVAAQSRITNDWLGLNKSEAPAASFHRHPAHGSADVRMAAAKP
jgi:hypothetical protein